MVPEGKQKSRRPQPVVVPLAERSAYRVPEWAALYGKGRLWGYRQVWAGKVKTISAFGQLMIPRSEVDRIAATATALN